MSEPVNPINTELDAAVSNLQSTEAAAEVRISALIDTLNVTITSLQNKLASANPPLPNIDAEIAALSAVADKLNVFEAPVPEPVPTSS
jgi:hypothetical protein